MKKYFLIGVVGISCLTSVTVHAMQYTQKQQGMLALQEQAYNSDMYDKVHFANQSLDDLLVQEENTGELYKDKVEYFLIGLFEQAHKQYEETLLFFARHVQDEMEDMAWKNVGSFEKINVKLNVLFVDLKRELESLQRYFMAQYYDFLKRAQVLPSLGDSELYEYRVKKQLEILTDEALENAASLVDRLQFNVKQEIAFEDLQEAIERYAERGKQQKAAMQADIEANRKSDWEKFLSSMQSVFHVFKKNVKTDLQNRLKDLGSVMVDELGKKEHFEDISDSLPSWVSKAASKGYDAGKGQVKEAINKSVDGRFQDAKESIQNAGRSAAHATAEELENQAFDRFKNLGRQYLPNAPEFVVDGLERVAKALTHGKRYEAKTALVETVRIFASNYTHKVLEQNILRKMPTAAKSVAVAVVDDLIQGQVAQAKQLLVQSVMQTKERIENLKLSDEIVKERVLGGFEKYKQYLAPGVQKHVKQVLDLVLKEHDSVQDLVLDVIKNYALRNGQEVLNPYIEKLPPMIQEPVKELLSEIKNL